MNRYDIKNIATGLITHSYEAETPKTAQPEWGTPEHEEQQVDSNGNPVLDETGAPVMITVPATFEIVITNLTGTAQDPRIMALRTKRDALLSACDFTQLSDAPFTADQKAAWAAYRTQLRQLPEITTDPSNPTWPVPPV